jgi:hypothetical protein
MKLTPDAPFPPSLCYSLRLFPLVLIIPSTPPGPPEIIANEPGRNLLRGNAAGMSICGGGGHRRALPCAAPGRHQRPAIATIPSSRRYDPRPPPFSFPEPQSACVVEGGRRLMRLHGPTWQVQPCRPGPLGPLPFSFSFISPSLHLEIHPGPAQSPHPHGPVNFPPI